MSENLFGGRTACLFVSFGLTVGRSDGASVDGLALIPLPVHSLGFTRETDSSCYVCTI